MIRKMAARRMWAQICKATIGKHIKNYESLISTTTHISKPSLKIQLHFCISDNQFPPLPLPSPPLLILCPSLTDPSSNSPPPQRALATSPPTSKPCPSRPRHPACRLPSGASSGSLRRRGVVGWMQRVKVPLIFYKVELWMEQDKTIKMRWKRARLWQRLRRAGWIKILVWKSKEDKK